MPLITLYNIGITFGTHALLHNANLQVNEGEKICLLGRNGEGKTTLLKIISEDIQPDNGKIIKNQNIKIARLSQEVPPACKGSIFDIVKSAFKENEVYEDHEIYSIISKLSLQPDVEFATLSGGLKRRVMLARALAKKPDMLLLDEPTNHLDIDSIGWLEKLLLNYSGTLLFVTHDRTFLRKIATRIVEIDRAHLTSWECDYNKYLKLKETQLIAEEQSAKNFDKKLAQEEHWIRHGISARRKRNQGRVRKLLELRKTKQARRTITNKAAMQLQQSEQSGRIIIEAKNIYYKYSAKPIINNFSTTILRGDKIGIIGANGCGKTTLLRILLDELQPQHGSIKYGTKLQIAHFDQLRTQLNENMSLRDNVSGGADKVVINGAIKHVLGYLQEFLFPPAKSLTLVKNLSGGEKNRLLLAKLFAKPANVLVLDEPTNDLDIETLELLEDNLVNYQGTILLVSHDRTFLNNVVTGTIVFENDERIQEYVGGYDDWIRQRSSIIEKKQKIELKTTQKPIQREKKLSYKERRELEALPNHIQKLEEGKEALQKTISSPEFYQQDKTKIIALQEELKNIEAELQDKYFRWEMLEAKQ